MSRRVVLPATAMVLAVALTSMATPALAAGQAPRAEIETDVRASSPAFATPGDEVVVQFRSGVTDAERAQVLASRGLEIVDEVDGSDFAVARPSGDGPAATTAGATEVVGVEPVVPMRAYGVPDDPAYPAQWHLPMVQAPRAWDVGDGTGAVVAVIDSGVAYRTSGTHVQAPDLAGVTFTAPRDFIDDDLFPDDLNGHGTHVTGTIAQARDNGTGGAGLAPGATIMPIRVLDADGIGDDFGIAAGLRWAADNGADIANLSLGGPTTSRVLADAVAYASAKGVTIVAASGNSDVAAVGYPAAYPQVIAVGAVRFDRERAPYSNYGSGLDLVAPGGDMTVDQNRDDYPDGILQQTLHDRPGAFCLCFMAGTSMAAPQVSAAAALLVGKGTSDPVAIRQALERSATDLGPAGRDDQFGHGLLQARAALEDFVPGRTSRPIDRACPAGTVPTSPFTDIGDAGPHRRSVECMAWRTIANGVTTTAYRPAAEVDRGQMATFLVRTIRTTGYPLPTSPVDAFDDDDGSVHEHAINQLAAVGVVKGSGGRSYEPDAAVTREALGTFLVRAHDLVSRTDLTVDTDYFDDDNTSVHQASINKAAAAGLTSGTAPGTYAPSLPLRRSQMASFLARLLELFIQTGYGSGI